MTDEATMYRRIGKRFAEHGTTLHGAKQYVDDDRGRAREALRGVVGKRLTYRRFDNADENQAEA